METLDQVVGKTCHICKKGTLAEKHGIREVAFNNQILEVPERYVQCSNCSLVPAVPVLVKEYLANLKSAKAKIMFDESHSFREGFMDDLIKDAKQHSSINKF